MKNINTISVLFIALLFTTAISAQSWWKNSIKGNGNVTKVTRTTDDYNAVRCAGFMDFELVNALLQYSAAKLSPVHSVMLGTLYTVSLKILPGKAFAHAPCSEILMEN